MPELPEVECTLRRIASDLTGRRILSFRSSWPRKVLPSCAEFARRVKGRAVLPPRRHGKRLLLPLSDGGVVSVHLGMSGHLEYGQGRAAEGRHRRAVFILDRGRLEFFDARKFGRIAWHPSLDAAREGLGPDALDPALDAEAFFRQIAGGQRPVKSALLDQARVAGIGNIYSDEALFGARIHPLRPAGTLSRREAATLLRCVRRVLEASIRRQGTSIDWVWPGGRMQHHLKVYGRSGQPCPRCKKAVQKIVIAGRGCHFCPACQPFLR